MNRLNDLSKNESVLFIFDINRSKKGSQMTEKY